MQCYETLILLNGPITESREHTNVNEPFYADELEEAAAPAEWAEQYYAWMSGLVLYKGKFHFMYLT